MELDYNIISPGDDLSLLDFAESDGTDPLGVAEFARTKAAKYHENKIATVRVVRDKKEIVAYFTVSMSAISVDILASGEKVEGVTSIRYPAMLLGQLGVDKKYRGKRIGSDICNFCLGLADVLGKQIACRYVILQTGTTGTSLYKRFEFRMSAKPPVGKKIWMYRRLG
ncbi:GNAT family N-acetyltransferase [Candidatus Nitrosotalea okcheonensis]|uniref:Putative GCN5-like N-acetyltransferase n=1 Tax=Candidatus Nitrosotalea okcheonensis TaxID=1903276 RepID=A0A2H1FEW3_9ARCH|nr:GNAT family N-acetyltransferase [Candidatus Nitrosotalea okcheonensis]SMH71281.1 putative GCN5-like N-acetyltransferase [Candidatus Nitrosotalea okcheonensis]